MAFEIVLMPRAFHDLDEITWHIAKDNPAAAERFERALHESTLPLAQFPELGRMVPEMENPSIREIIHGSYRIIYRVVKNLHQVQVLRFWHAARGNPQL
jgi:plasmid stabilization system protein ParE